MFNFLKRKRKEESLEERLERLYLSGNPLMRGQAAWSEYKLEKLIDDPHPYVRACVADTFYGLDQLISDSNPVVSSHVQYLLDIRKITIEEWIEQNPCKCALKENKIFCPNCKVNSA